MSQRMFVGIKYRLFVWLAKDIIKATVKGWDSDQAGEIVKVWGEKYRIVRVND